MMATGTALDARAGLLAVMVHMIAVLSNAQADNGKPSCAPWLNMKVTTTCSECHKCFQFKTDPCVNKCMNKYDNDLEKRWQIKIRHGTYKSSYELQNEIRDDWRSQRVAANETDPDFPTNDDVNAIDVLTIPSDVERFFVLGGTHTMLRGYVINVTIAPKFLMNSTVNYVMFKNLNLGETKPVLSTLIPPTVKRLGLSNALLTDISDDLLKMGENLTDLSLDFNFLTEIPASVSFPKLTSLTVAVNDLTSFNGTFPKLTFLNLSSNNLLSIPDVIFKMPNLTTLDLSANKFSNIRLTNNQYKYLSRPDLKVRLDSKIGDTSCSETKIRQVVTETSEQVRFCIAEESTPRVSTDTPKPTSTVQKNSSSGVIVGGAIGALAFVGGIIGIWWYRSRRARRRHDSFKHDNIEEFSTSDSRFLSGENNWFADDRRILAMRLDAAELQDIKCIGAGGFGEVWLVAYQGRKLAAKRLLSRSDNSHASKFIDEIKLNASLSHAHIVRFEGVSWTSGTDLQALFEYMPQGDLRTWLANTDKSCGWTAQKLRMTMDIVDALVYVHSFNPPLVHRDLKSRNILLDDDLRAKLCDFGIARFQSYLETMTVGVGTGLWLAPEIIACRSDYNQFADIYSFGVVLSELDTHAVPYAGATGTDGQPLHETAIIHQVAMGTLKPTFLPSCPMGIRGLADVCLSKNPEERPTAISVAHTLSILWREAGFLQQNR